MTIDETISEETRQQPKGRATRKKAAATKKNTGQTKNATKRRTRAEPAASRTKKSVPTRAAREPRTETKGAKIHELIGRPKGATLAELMKATGWQPHSVRGFISTAGKKAGIRISSKTNEGGERVYHIAKSA
jgi:hypothetical protein